MKVESVAYQLERKGVWPVSLSEVGVASVSANLYEGGVVSPL